MPKRLSKRSILLLDHLPRNGGPPRPDEIEFSLFGPGYGECAVIHVGEGEWVVVDSCVSDPRAQPVALDYLEGIGVSPEASVKLVVATHWHDDHIRGLAKLVAACKSAEFACTAALGQEDFRTLAELTRTDLMMESSGIDEFRSILDELFMRSQEPMWTLGGRTLYQRATNPSVEILALTPSDRAFRESVSEIARLLPSENEPKRRVWPAGPNHGSVVLSIRVGSAVLLLGADLEEDSGGRWSALLAAHTLAAKADVFKIPHHGSSGADHPRVWNDLVKPQAVATLTPFQRGSVALPTAADRTRICNYGRRTFITATPERPKSRRRESAVEKTIREVVGELKPANGPMGHVRVRHDLGEADSDWSVSSFGQAFELCARLNVA